MRESTIPSFVKRFCVVLWLGLGGGVLGQPPGQAAVARQSEIVAIGSADALLKYFTDKDPNVRLAAVIRMTQLEIKSVDILFGAADAADRERDWYVQNQMSNHMTSMGMFPGPNQMTIRAMTPQIIAKANEGPVAQRCQAVRAIQWLELGHSQEAVDACIAAIKSNDPALAMAGINASGQNMNRMQGSESKTWQLLASALIEKWEKDPTSHEAIDRVFYSLGALFAAPNMRESLQFPVIAFLVKQLESADVNERAAATVALAHHQFDILVMLDPKSLRDGLGTKWHWVHAAARDAMFRDNKFDPATELSAVVADGNVGAAQDAAVALAFNELNLMNWDYPRMLKALESSGIPPQNPPPAALQADLSQLSNRDAEARLGALSRLTAHGDAAQPVIVPIIALFADPDPKVAAAARKSFQKIVSSPNAARHPTSYPSEVSSPSGPTTRPVRARPTTRPLADNELLVPIPFRELPANTVMTREILANPKTGHIVCKLVKRDELIGKNVITDAARIIGRVLKRPKHPGSLFTEEDFGP